MNPSISQYIPSIPYIPYIVSMISQYIYGNLEIFPTFFSEISTLQQLICAPRAAPAPRRSEGLRHSWPRHRAPAKKWVVDAYNVCIYIY